MIYSRQYYQNIF